MRCSICKEGVMKKVIKTNTPQEKTAGIGLMIMGIGFCLTIIGAIKEHTPDLITTFNLGYQYQPEANCPKWEKYLSEVQADAKNREVIQMLFGLSLIPDTSFEVFFIFFGESGTGKSVCLKVLEAVVNSENVTTVPLNKFAEKHSTHLLTEKLLNIVGDLPTAGNSSNLSQIEGLLKDVASGGNVPVEHKGVDPWNAPAIARCIFATNSLPNFADRSGGIWDRLRIIPFNKKFRHTDKQNPYLSREIIKEELPGVLNWSIGGLEKLKQLNQFPDTEEGKKLADAHRFCCDHEKEFFNEFYTEKTGSYVTKQMLYDNYREYCSRNGYRPKSKAKFNFEVKRIFKTAYESREIVTEGRSVIWRNISKV